MVHFNPGDRLKRLPAYFYRSATGREPVREWLKGLDPDDRKIVGEDVKDVEYAWPIGMPLVRSLGNELWEVRSSLTGGKIGRVIFCVEGSQMVLLHGIHQEDAQDAEEGHRPGAQENERQRPMNKKNIGSSFDSWLQEEGIQEQVTAAAIKRVLARQIEAAMKEEGLTKKAMAERMETSRSALDRLLDPDYESVTLSTLQKAAAAVGRQVRLELV